MKNYKLLIINGNCALRAIFIRRLRRGNNTQRILFLFAEGVKNLSEGCKFHLSFIVYHFQFIIKKMTAPLAAGGSKENKFQAAQASAKIKKN